MTQNSFLKAVDVLESRAMHPKISSYAVVNWKFLFLRERRMNFIMLTLNEEDTFENLFIKYIKIFMLMRIWEEKSF